MDWIDEAALLEAAEAWVAEVDAAYADGGYAAGDNPRPPLEEMQWLLNERQTALAKLDGLHQVLNHLQRIVEANPGMRIADAMAVAYPPRVASR